MMALGGYISSPDDFHEIQKMDDNLELKSSDPKERMKQLLIKAQKTTDRLPREKKEAWNKLLKEASGLNDKTSEIWGDSEKNQIIDKVDQKLTKFIVEYVAEKVRQREEERKSIEEKGFQANESLQLMNKFKTSNKSKLGKTLNINLKPKLTDDLIKINADIDKNFKLIVNEVAAFDKVFENYIPRAELSGFTTKRIDGFNDLLSDKLNIQRKSLEEMGVDNFLIQKISNLSSPKDYRNFINAEKDFFRDLFTKQTPNGFIVKFDVLKNFKNKLSSEFYSKFSKFSQHTRLQDLLEDYEMEGQIEGGRVSSNGINLVVKSYDRSSNSIIGRKLEDGIAGKEYPVKIYTNTVIEFNVRSLEMEYDLDGAQKDLEKEFNYNSSFEDLENQILDLKFNREIFERAGDNNSLVKLKDKIYEGEALLELKNYGSNQGYESFFTIEDLENSDGWVENLSAFANVDFLEKLQSDFSDIDYDEASLREGDLMDLSVKVVGYKLNCIQAKLDLLPVDSKIREFINQKLQKENQRFIDISLNLGDSNEDKNALNEELGLKRVSDHMISLGSFEAAYEYFVDRSAVIDSNNFQSENLRKVYQNFNKKCLYILQNYLNNERDLVISLGSEAKDYNKYLEKVNKLAKFITGRGESIDMDLESGGSALALLTQALKLPEKIVESNWNSAENVLMNDYKKYKIELKTDVSDLSQIRLNDINESFDGQLDELLDFINNEPQNIEEFTEKYMTLRVLRDAIKGYEIDLNRYNVFLNNGVNDYKLLCIKHTKDSLANSGNMKDFVDSFAGNFSNEEMKLVNTLSDIQGFGWFDMSDQTIHNTVFVTKFTALVGSSLAASLLSTPFTGGASLLAGATSVAAIATTASHVLYGKGYDTTEEAMIGIGAEAGVNFFGALGGGSFGSALRISAIQKSSGLTREAVKKGLLTGDEALSIGVLTKGDKALYFTGQMVGDITLNAGLDIAVAKMTKEESNAFVEFEKSVSNPANWAVRIGGVSAGALGGGKFSKFISMSRDPNATISFSNLKVGEKKSLLRLYDQNGGKIDNRIISYIKKLVDSDKLKIKSDFEYSNG